MGGAASHQRTSNSASTSLDQPSPHNSPPQSPIKEKLAETPLSSANLRTGHGSGVPSAPECAGKQRRKTFSSLGIRGSFDFRGQSFDVGSTRSRDSWTEKDEPEDLSDREKEILTSTWKQLEGNIARVGVITFISLFETHPDVQESFMSFKGHEIEDLKHSKQLKAHALRVMAFVQKAVARLHEPEKLDTLIKELGRKHVNYGAKKKYIRLVGPQFIQAIQPSLEGQWNEELQSAWTHLFDVIEYTMTNTMLDEERRVKAQKD